MTTLLSSLRVTADMDASGFTAGAAAIEDANRRMAASGELAGAALARQDAGTDRAKGSLAALSREYIPGYSGAARFSKEVDRLQNQLESGNASAERATQIYTALTAKYQQYADATKLITANNADFSRIVDGVNERMSLQVDVINRAIAANQNLSEAQKSQAGFNERLGVTSPTASAGTAQASAGVFQEELGKLEEIARLRAQQIGQNFGQELDSRMIAGTGKSARDSASVFEAEFSKIDEIARLKAQQIGAEYQRSLNEQMGIGAQPKSAQASAGVFQEADQQAQALDNLRAKYSPLYDAQRKYITSLNEIKSAGPAAFKNQTEYADAIQRTKTEFAKQVVVINESDAALKRHDGTLGGATTQASALAAAIRHMFDASAAGMSPMRVLMMEAGNLSFGLSGVGTVLEWLKAKFLAAAGWFTPAKVAVIAIASAFGLATAAIFSWNSAQRDIVLGLSGIGRASGVTVANINALADAHSSLATVSVSQGRQTALSLAATGKVGTAVIGDLIELSHDFAKAFGVDNAKAAQLLAKSFADPARGADELNMRLGFLSAATQRNIQDLVSQNRMYEAQKIIVEGLKSSLPKTVEVTGSFSQLLNYVTNAASNGFTAVGKWISDINGWSATANEQLKSAQDKLAKLEAQPDPWIGPKRGVKELKEEIAKLQAAIEATDRATLSAKSNLDSLAVSASVFSALPEIDAARSARNRSAVTGRVSEDPVLQQNLGITQTEADQGNARMKELTAGWEKFRTEAALTAAQTRVAIAAITARSPEERAAIARAQTTLQLIRQGLDPSEKKLQIDLAGTRAAKEAQFALSEAARVRLLTIKDAIGQSEIDVAVIGKNVQQTTLLQENWKAYVELRREAAQNHTKFDEAQYERLKRENEELARKKQFTENSKIAYDIRRDSQTAFLTSEDVQIAEKLKGKYEDVARAINSFEAAQMRANNAVRGLSQELSGGLTNALVDISMGTKKTGDAFRSFGLMAVQALQRMIIQLMIIGPLMRSLQSSFGDGIFSLFGFGGGGAPGIDGLANGGIMTSRGQIPLNRYAGGGVANSPQIALFGEGRRPEAYVPLPDGRSIPVNINVPQGYGGGGGTVINVSQVNNISGSGLSKEELMAVMAQNNKELTKQINAALPDRVAAIQRDPRRRGA